MSGRRRRYRTLSSNEERLWRLVTRDAEPLADRSNRPAVIEENVPDDRAPAHEPEPVAPGPQAQAPLRPFRIGEAADDPHIQVRRSLPGLEHGASPGVDRRTAERFKRGRMDIDGRLDLHGMTQEGAHVALTTFIERSAAAGKRCVLVITGKGTRGEGILRRAVPRWLNEPRLRTRILAFTQARPQHGGEGALYVLLKRKRAP